MNPTDVPHRRYDAFISYRSATSARAAKQLQRALVALSKRHRPQTPINLFLDTESLEAGGLNDRIRTGLHQSRSLIVLLATGTNQSPWVNIEVDHWLRHGGAINRLFLVRHDPTLRLDWNYTTNNFAYPDALPQVLSGLFPTEQKWLDLRQTRFGTTESTLAGLYAPIAGVPPEALLLAENDFQQRQRRRARLVTSALALLLVMALVAGIAFLLQRNEAREQRDLVTTRQLMLETTAQAQKDPELSRLLAVAANEIAPGELAEAASDSLRTAVLNPARRVLDAHEKGVTDIAFTASGDRFVTASLDGTLRVWDAKTYAPLTDPVMVHDGGSIEDIAFGPDDMLATAGAGGLVRLWDIDDLSQPIRSLTGHRKSVQAVVFRADGTVVTGDLAGSLRVWDSKTGTQLAELMQASSDVSISSLDLADNGLLAVGMSPGVFSIWDIDARQKVAGPVDVGTDWVHSLKFSPLGILAIGDSSGDLQFWDARQWRRIGHPLSGHTGRVVTDIAFGDDGMVATSGDDGTLRIWDVYTGTQRMPPLIGHRFQVETLEFAPDGTLLSGGSDGTVRLWNVRELKPIGSPLLGHDEQILAAGFGQNGIIVTGGDEGTIEFWRNTDGNHRPERTIESGQDPINGLAFGPDGLLATASFDGTVRFWDVTTGNAVGDPLATDQHGVFDVAFGPDGIVATAGEDGTVKLWESDMRTQRGETLRVDDANVTAIAFDDNLLAAGDRNGLVRIWDVATGTEIHDALDEHIFAVWDIAFGPDGTMATASADRSIILWNPTTGDRIGEPIDGPESWFYAATFAPGNTLVAGDTDGDLRIVDVATHEQIGPTASPHGDGITVVEYDPDSGRLLTASWDGTARLFDLGFLTDDPTETACSQVTRELTNDERAAYLPGHEDLAVC